MTLRVLLTIDETAEAMGMSAGWVKKQIRGKALIPVKLGKVTRIPVSEVLRYSREHAVTDFVPALYVYQGIPGKSEMAQMAEIITGDRK